MTTQTLVLVNNLNGFTRSREAWSVHAEGCADVAAEVAKGGEVETTGTLADLVGYFASNYGEDAGYEGGWTIDHAKVQPCTKRGPKAPKAIPAGRCPGSGQASTTKVDFRLVYPHGTCPVCARSFGAKTGRIATHNVAKVEVAKPKCSGCGETTLHRSGVCSICRAWA